MAHSNPCQVSLAESSRQETIVTHRSSELVALPLSVSPPTDSAISPLAELCFHEPSQKWSFISSCSALATVLAPKKLEKAQAGKSPCPSTSTTPSQIVRDASTGRACYPRAKTLMLLLFRRVKRIVSYCDAGLSLPLLHKGLKKRRLPNLLARHQIHNAAALYLE